MMVMYINIAIWLEKTSLLMKRKVSKSVLNKFLKQYLLTDGRMQNKTDIRFNPYEGTNPLLIDELIKSGELKKSDKLLDVGCGAGIFLIYLASKGFQNLQGVEIDPGLSKLCNQNIRNFKAKSGYDFVLNVVCKNALDSPIDNDVVYFYMFNTFYDKDTYINWLKQVEISLCKNPRAIKIIILYPTVASMGAMRECGWLYEKRRVLCKSQVCYRCVNFIIYESVE